MLSMSGRRKNYAWGSPTSIPALLGVAPDGQPWAEVWYGTHPSGPAVLPDEGTLDVYIDEHPAVLGRTSRDRFGDRLPFLVKLLAAQQALSIQVHPNREQAESGFAREDAAGLHRNAPHRNYRDNWPKPELVIAIDPFDALCGFRHADAIAADYELLRLSTLAPVIARLRADGPEAERIRAAFVWLTSLPAAEASGLAEQVIERAAGLDTPTAALICEIGETYPGDVGVLVAAMLNRIVLRPRQGLFLGSGTVHAYLRGTGVEVMANSDNVLRGGLTGKHIDVAELCQVASFGPWDPPVVVPTPVSPGVERYETPAPEFRVWTIRPDVADALPGDGLPRVVLALSGETLIGQATLRAGQAVFIGADESRIPLAGHGLCVCTTPGLL